MFFPSILVPSPLALRKLILRTGVIVVVSVLTAGASACASARVNHPSVHYPGPRLTVVQGIPVFASFLNAPYTSARRRAICPRHPMILETRMLTAAAKAVAQAMPTLFAGEARAAKAHGRHIDLHHVVANATRSASAHASGMYEAYCGAPVWHRSVFVIVRFPDSNIGASLSMHSFDVAQTPEGWVIWAEAL